MVTDSAIHPVFNSMTFARELLKDLSRRCITHKKTSIKRSDLPLISLVPAHCYRSHDLLKHIRSIVVFIPTENNIYQAICLFTCNLGLCSLLSFIWSTNTHLMNHRGFFCIYVSATSINKNALIPVHNLSPLCSNPC